MRTHIVLFVILTVILTGVTAGSARGEPVELSPRQVGSHVLESWTGSQGEGVVARFQPTTLPFRETHAAVDGESTSVSHYELSDRGFEIAVDHIRSAGDHAAVESRGALAFTVDRRVRYEIQGSYEAADPERPSSRFDVFLLDAKGSPAFLLETQQWSDAAGNPLLLLGSEEGKGPRRHRGAASGHLDPSGYYRLLYRFQIGAGDSPERMGTATGRLALRFLPVPACEDGIDNDGDGTTDFPSDGNCVETDAPSEGNPSTPTVSQGPPSACGLGVELPLLLALLPALRRAGESPARRAR